MTDYRIFASLLTANCHHHQQEQVEWLVLEVSIYSCPPCLGCALRWTHASDPELGYAGCLGSVVRCWSAEPYGFAAAYRQDQCLCHQPSWIIAVVNFEIQMSSVAAKRAVQHFAVAVASHIAVGSSPAPVDFPTGTSNPGVAAAHTAPFACLDRASCKLHYLKEWASSPFPPEDKEMEALSAWWLAEAVANFHLVSFQGIYVALHQKNSTASWAWDHAHVICHQWSSPGSSCVRYFVAAEHNSTFLNLVIAPGATLGVPRTSSDPILAAGLHTDSVIRWGSLPNCFACSSSGCAPGVWLQFILHCSPTLHVVEFTSCNSASVHSHNSHWGYQVNASQSTP